ncbi:MAG: alpha/beta hydrolase [Lachnospiraceae bacterium]|nr:alpha/beta hydrolase [Lachnospiraceae bacterium]
MKLAVIFPGIGYHVDKPLLYYSRKIAENYGYQTITVPYGNFPAGVKGSVKKMEDSFYSALAQAEGILKDIDFTLYDEILFISKSVGTAVAAAYGQNHSLITRNVYYTPVGQSFPLMNQPGIVFHGTGDGWVETALVREECKKKELPLYVIENANHSLETGDVRKDLVNIQIIMDKTEEYIKNIPAGR